MKLVCVLGLIASVNCCKDGEIAIHGKCHPATLVSHVKPSVASLAKELIETRDDVQGHLLKSFKIHDFNMVTKEAFHKYLVGMKSRFDEATQDEIDDIIAVTEGLSPGGDGKMFSLVSNRHADDSETLAYHVLAVKANRDKGKTFSFVMTSYTQTIQKLSLMEFAKKHTIKSLPIALTAMSAAFFMGPGVAESAMTAGAAAWSTVRDFIADYQESGNLNQRDKDMAEALFMTEMQTRSNALLEMKADGQNAGFYIGWKPVAEEDRASDL